MERILLYDTTLRDGMQREGMSLSVGEQLQVALRLAAVGMDVVEAGFPSSNPKDSQLFDLLQAENLGATRIAAFGMTRRRDTAPGADPGLRIMVETFAPVSTIVGKTWDLHLQKVTKVSREENLKMIGESVAFLLAEGKDVFYDAEHFFDAYTEHPDYALECLRAAHGNGATWVVLCDTNGATLPHVVERVTREVRLALPGAAIGIHTHNDAECAVANSLIAVEQGARQVQGTINGWGERCGNANLITLAPSLSLKMGFDVLRPGGLSELTNLSHWAAETANLPPDPWAPYVGVNAFTHKGGMHVAGMVADPRTFEHIDPSLVGNERGMKVSELSGRHVVLERAREAGIDVESDPDLAPRILARIKQLEHAGYHFEVADASFTILLEREAGIHEPVFVLESFRVVTERNETGSLITQATVRVHHDGMRLVATAEGNGPVNALDKALREALAGRVPEIDAISLVNFKVRILDEDLGTQATTRVLIDSSDGTSTWSTMGVNQNVIAAAWDALVDSFDYGVRRAGISSSAGTREA
ncbi:MAG: citramalate synthase [Thermoleophilia bacterium]|nr:citramalate synthase [Thermoleophilia bacterium]